MFKCINGHTVGFKPREFAQLQRRGNCGTNESMPGWRCIECGSVIETDTLRCIRWYLDSSFMTAWLSEGDPTKNTHHMHVPSCVEKRSPRNVLNEGAA